MSLTKGNNLPFIRVCGRTDEIPPWSFPPVSGLAQGLQPRPQGQTQSSALHRDRQFRHRGTPCQTRLGLRVEKHQFQEQVWSIHLEISNWAIGFSAAAFSLIFSCFRVCRSGEQAWPPLSGHGWCSPHAELPGPAPTMADLLSEPPYCCRGGSAHQLSGGCKAMTRGAGTSLEAGDRLCCQKPRTVLASWSLLGSA